MNRERIISALLLFVGMVSIVTVIFTFFHVLPLAVHGLTSNEHSKLADVKAYFENGGPAVSYERRGKSQVARSFKDIKNMYNTGSVWSNLGQFLGSPPRLPKCHGKIKR